ncbi:hypothetical protein V6R21_12750 [Limibacter armeniacum]|uniref:hypothetical protein n=1 Tax=Limibacter armeniacum TaxID=466084 RepID=UPI002FE5C2AF
MKGKTFFYILLFFAFNLLTSNAKAQTVSNDIASMNDPFMKPELWAKLKTQPDNDYFWKLYFGKDLFDLPEDQYKIYEGLRQKLIKEENKRRAAVKKKIIERKIAEEAETNNRFASDPIYQDLVSNISKNFVMIEMYFTDKFEEAGSEYVSYFDMYPNNDYNKIQWVDEHEHRLGELLRMKELNNNTYKGTLK